LLSVLTKSFIQMFQKITQSVSYQRSLTKLTAWTIRQTRRSRRDIKHRWSNFAVNIISYLSKIIFFLLIRIVLFHRKIIIREKKLIKIKKFYSCENSFPKNFIIIFIIFKYILHNLIHIILFSWIFFLKNVQL